MASDEATTAVDSEPEVDVNSVQHTLKVAILLCLACSVLVSVFAVGLRGIQNRKKEEFRQQNILRAAGLWEDGANTQELFAQRVRQVALNLETGEASESEDVVAEVDVKAALNDKEESSEVENDIANIKRREDMTVVYQIAEDGKLKTLVLPIRGYGLWSTLWGFIALDVSDIESGPDAIQIKGLTYYDQKETPGLGGEVDNPLWKAKWVGKKAFDENWNVRISVEKGASGLYEVDALSGATITSRGVNNMLAYWLGDEGFGPYLKQLAGTTEADEEPGASDDAAPTPAAADEDQGDEKNKANANG